MKRVRVITGRGVPLTHTDVDTDQIIPSDWLKRVERTGYGEGLFSEWRENSDFVLNQQRFEGANVLVAGENFGTGSSREHAVWALDDYGFEVVISPRFGDIFRNNCSKLGLVTVEIDAEHVVRLQEALDDDHMLEIVVDVEERRVAVPALGIDEPFPLDDHTHFRMLNGYDDIGLTLRHHDAVTEFESDRHAWLPTTHDRVADDDLVVVVRTDTPAEADVIVAILEADDIRAYAAHRRLEDLFPTLFSEEGTAVLVRADDVDRARERLSD